MRNPDQVLTADQMRGAEQVLVAQGVSIDELMLRAGRGAADWVHRTALGRSVTVLCGPGNNGGDGYVVAEHLRHLGSDVRVIAPMDPATDAARRAKARWQGNQVEGARGGVLVDCLFGSGLSRPLASEHSDLLAKLADAHEFVIAVDLPSGVSSDDGAILGTAVRCDLTLALGAWKPAHFMMPASDCMGEVRLVDIGIELASTGAHLFTAPRFSAPARGAHKYSRGMVGVVGGVMPGAALLAAEAAMRSGAGYVKHLAQPLPATHARALVNDSRPIGLALADPRFSALVIGPGLGRDEAARQNLGMVLERGIPTVIDADALHVLDDDLLEGVAAARLLLTPHEGELAALCRRFAIAASGKIDRAKTLAQTIGATVLAKGPDTLLAGAGGELAFFAPGPSWLATAGTGDVLAGIAASRMAAGRDPFRAAGEAVWLHGEAARVAGPALIADDLIRNLSAAYDRFLRT